MKKKRRAASEAAEQIEAEVPAAPAPEVTAVVDGEPGDVPTWDDEAERLFFARGDALETGELLEHEVDTWHDRGGRFGRMTLPKAAALSIGVILASLWLLAH